MQAEETDILTITEEEAGERLDKILAKRFVEVHSRTYFQTLIEEHLVLLNGEPVKKRIRPQAGDEVEVHFSLTPEIKLVPEPIALDILYEDEELLAINKPAGLVVHPAPGNWNGTFVNALLYHCHQLPVSEDLRPGIVHRLDKDTSGVLVAAKTTWMQQQLTALFASRQVYKEYVAICVGNPGEGTIDAPIGRHPVHRKQMAVRPDGRQALSSCKTYAFNGKLSIAYVVIATGRTNQIRVHLKHRGAPVLGDSVYGNTQQNKLYGIERQMLHAGKLCFTHPRSGKVLELKASLPSDMQNMCQKIDPQFNY